jgi:hypothetical protein
MDWTDSLPTLDVANLPTVFDTQADRARTDGRLQPGHRQKRVNIERRQFVNAKRQTNASRFLTTLPGAAEALHLILDGEFEAHMLIPRVIDLAGETCDTLDLATLGFHDAALDTLTALSDGGKVGRIRLLCSHYFRSQETTLFSRAHHELTKRGHALFIARSHMKLQVFGFASGRAVTVTSSANLRSCKNAEYSTIFGDPMTAAFCRATIDELIAEAARCAARRK